MKQLNITITDEAHKKLKTLVLIKGTNQDTVIDELLRLNKTVQVSE